MHKPMTWSIARGLSILTGVSATLVAIPASADVELVPLVVIDFSAFDGSGFDPEPAAGQLDSDDWSVRVNDGAIVDFGEVGGGAGSDFARGLGTGGTDVQGIWAFDVDGAGLIALGAQPTDEAFTDGDIRLRLVNNTGADVTEFQVEYTLWVNNDEVRAYSVILQQSVDNAPASYTDVGTEFVSPGLADKDGFTATDLTEVVTPEAAIADGAQYYIAWHGYDADEKEEGNRDEFGIEGITIRLLNVCGNGLMEGEEACDDGLDNIDTGACTSTCAVAACGDGFVQDAVEECDDSNTDDGDGCSATCMTEGAADSSGSGGADTTDTAADESSGSDSTVSGASNSGASATNATNASGSDSDSDTDDDTGNGGEDDDTVGCSCDSSGGGAPVWGMLGLLGIGVARRRRR
ncbi:MAG: DUF4215 domain-containing protein [Deltaproteobacteria bacterium]|nr:DUF4215 domain-containing protein [Nannocystaceae bacterium]